MSRQEERGAKNGFLWSSKKKTVEREGEREDCKRAGGEGRGRESERERGRERKTRRERRRVTDRQMEEKACSREEEKQSVLTEEVCTPCGPCARLRPVYICSSDSLSHSSLRVGSSSRQSRSHMTQGRTVLTCCSLTSFASLFYFYTFFCFNKMLCCFFGFDDVSVGESWSFV